MSAYVNCTYPELVDDWDGMSEIEVRGVVELYDGMEGEDTCCEIDDQNPEWYSVYVRHTEGWSYCISDQTDRLSAIEFMVQQILIHPHLRIGRHCLKIRG